MLVYLICYLTMLGGKSVYSCFKQPHSKAGVKPVLKESAYFLLVIPGQPCHLKLTFIHYIYMTKLQQQIHSAKNVMLTE